MAAATLGMREALSDVALFASMLCLGVDAWGRWLHIPLCERPMHVWMAISYCLVGCARLLHILGALASPGGADEFLVNLRPAGVALQGLTFVAWLVVFPLQSLWALGGAALLVRCWFGGPSFCLEKGVFLAFIFLWQGLNFIWAVTHAKLAHAAWERERAVRALEADLCHVASQDPLARWGTAASMESYGTMVCGEGLRAAEIAALGDGVLGCGDAEVGCKHPEDCSICVDALAHGDCVRRLGCGHTFHRSCIDLWLVRRAACPLCKRSVARAAPLSKKGGSCHQHCS